MRKLILALLPLTIGTAVAAQAASWATSATCVVTMPGETPTFHLVMLTSVNEVDEKSSRLQVRVDTDSPVLADKERVSGAKIEVSGQGEFAALNARGSAHGDFHRVTISVSDDQELLSAMARGTTMDLSIPTSSGEESLTFNLAGSALAIQHLEKCR